MYVFVSHNCFAFMGETHCACACACASFSFSLFLVLLISLQINFFFPLQFTNDHEPRAHPNSPITRYTIATISFIPLTNTYKMNHLLSFSLKLYQTPWQNHAQSVLIWNELQVKQDLKYYYSGLIFIGFPTCVCVCSGFFWERNYLTSCVDGLIQKSFQDSSQVRHNTTTCVSEVHV